MEDSSKYIVRPMQPSEVDDAHDLVRHKGHLISRERYSLVYKNFPEAFYVAVDTDGTVEGAASFIQSVEGVFTIGYVVGSSQSKHHSIEKLLLTDAPDIFLYTALLVTAQPGKDPFFINLGFDICETQEDHCVFDLTVDRENLRKRISGQEKAEADFSTRPYLASDLGALIEYDNEARGLDNSRYTTAMVQCNTVMLAVSGKGLIVGYAGAYHSQCKLVMDGVFADSDEVASCLFSSILERFPDSDDVRLQTPESKVFLSSFGTVVSRQEARKYEFEGRIPRDKTDKMYCATDTHFTF